MIASEPGVFLWELYAALIVPDRSRKGAASSPDGVTGAGSKPSRNASDSVKVPYEGESASDICAPKAT